MPAAWAKASGDGNIPPRRARSTTRRARPLQDITGKPVNYNYFSQTLLPDYIEKHGLGCRL